MPVQLDDNIVKDQLARPKINNWVTTESKETVTTSEQDANENNGKLLKVVADQPAKEKPEKARAAAAEMPTNMTTKKVKDKNIQSRNSQLIAWFIFAF